ncbi:MAG: HYR domain-containing protein, partial [Flavobacteriaceae bacterium]|nr:HYR domain-containing protein [Flavobacteriaceae bacterium]
MKKTTFFILAFIVFLTSGTINAQRENIATARGVDDSFSNPAQNRAINAVVYNTTHGNNQGAEITTAAGGPNHSMGDAIVLAGTERLINSITVDLFNLASSANFDLTVRIYTGCPTSGASGPCGSGVGILVPGSTLTQTITPGTLGTLYQRTLTYPVPVDLTAEVDNTITVMLTASRNDVFWRLGETPVIGAMPAGETGNGFATRCGSATANNGCTRNFGIPNNFAMTILATGPTTVCGNVPLTIPATGTSGLMNPSIANVPDTGVIGVDFTISNISLNLVHTFAADLEIVIVSPAGTRLALCTDNGGVNGLDVVDDLLFTDASANNITGWDSGPPLADYRAEGGGNTFPVGAGDGPGVDLNTIFDGQSITGNWTLEINDDVGGDVGTLNSFCITFDPILVIGDPPVISCPANITADNAVGQCGAVVNFAAVAVDTEDGNISGSIVYTPDTGSFFPVGTTTVTASVTDSDGNTSTCTFDVTVVDVEDPVVTCSDITVDLDATGNVTVLPGDVASVTDNCPGTTLQFQGIGGPSGAITTLFNSNNGGSPGWVVMYDLTVGASDIEITGFDMNTSSTSAFNLEVYTLVGTFVGNQTNPGAWTLTATGSGTGAGTNNPSNVTLVSPITLSAGITYGIGLRMVEAGPQYSGTGTNPAPGSTSYSNADLSLSLGSAVSGLFTGSVFTPRIWNGTIYYGSPAPPVPSLDFSCMEVGPNNVTVIATDAAGNTSTCTAVVTVEDNIAPVIACIGEPVPVTDSSSDSPG